MLCKRWYIEQRNSKLTYAGRLVNGLLLKNEQRSPDEVRMSKLVGCLRMRAIDGKGLRSLNVGLNSTSFSSCILFSFGPKGNQFIILTFTFPDLPAACSWSLFKITLTIVLSDIMRPPASALGLLLPPGEVPGVPSGAAGMVSNTCGCFASLAFRFKSFASSFSALSMALERAL